MEGSYSVLVELSTKELFWWQWEEPHKTSFWPRIEPETSRKRNKSVKRPNAAFCISILNTTTTTTIAVSEFHQTLALCTVSVPCSGRSLSNVQLSCQCIHQGDNCDRTMLVGADCKGRKEFGRVGEGGVPFLLSQTDNHATTQHYSSIGPYLFQASPQ